MALKLIRDNLKSLVWILWIVILALVFLIFFDWGGYNQRNTAPNQLAASVGDEEITYGELRSAHRNLESYYRETFGDQMTPEMLEQFNLPMQALNQLINQRILLMEAKSVGLAATDEEVRERILTFPAFQRNGRFVGAEEYETILRSLRLVPKEFHDSLRDSLMIEKLDAALASTAYVSDEDVERAYRDQVERAKIRFVQLPSAQMGDVEVTSSDLASYLEEHTEDFRVPEQRVVDYLLVDTNKLRAQINPTDEEIRGYYDANQDQYQREEQVTARHILRKITPERDDATARAEIDEAQRRIEAGEDFAAVAAELSEDELSGRNGGMLQPFGRGVMVRPFEDAVFSAADGTLIDPVQTVHGWHLIEKLGSTPAGMQPFEQVQAGIRARLQAERSTEIAEQKSLDVASRVTAEMSDDAVRALATEEGLEVVTTEPFGKDDTVAGLGRSQTFNQAAFDLAEVGGVSAPVRVPRGWAVLKLKEIREPRQPELAEVEDRVRAAVLAERQQEAALARLTEAAADGTSLDDLAAELGVEVKESSEFGRNGSIADLGRNKEVVEAALGLDAGETGGPFKTDQGAVLFEVTERTAFDPAEFEEAKESTRTAQVERRLQELKQLLLEQRRRELPIKNYATDLLTQQG